MNTELIQLKDVTKKFGKNIVLENINLDIPEKQITGIIGASGRGKTTILKMIIGFYKPNKGEITYLKRNVLKDLKKIRKIFGFSTEDGSFYNDLSVKENLYHFGSLYNMKRKKIKEKTTELLDFVGLSEAENTKARDLSVGMKKRLDFACSLIADPEVLILDEPTADLDPLLRSHILSLIQKIKKNGTTVILTTQLLEEMDQICDYIAILHEKKIVEKDTPKKIKQKYSCSDLNKVFEKIFSEKNNKKEKKKTEEKSSEKNKEIEEEDKKNLEKKDTKNKKTKFINKIEKNSEKLKDSELEELDKKVEEIYSGKIKDSKEEIKEDIKGDLKDEKFF